MDDIEYQALETNYLMNAIKLILALIFILFSAKAYHDIDFYGLNDVCFIALMLFIGWIYRINFKGIFDHKNEKIKILISKNLYGFSFIKLIRNETDTFKESRIHSKDFVYIDEVSMMKVELKLAVSFKPLCKITNTQEK